MTGKCRWCGQVEAGNAGDYYHEKDCHRRNVLARIDVAKLTDDQDEIDKLRRELHIASYTGD